MPISAANRRLRLEVAIIHGISALLIGAMLTGPTIACDFCLRLPRVPFEFDHPDAIQVAMATRAAAEAGQIDLNPPVQLASAGSGQRTAPLAEVTPGQLLTLWMRTRPAASVGSLRCSLEIIFVDDDFAASLDIRFGEILVGNPQNGPADVRLVTTKAGFYRLLEDGLIACEERELVAIEALQSTHLGELQRLFADSSMTGRHDIGLSASPTAVSPIPAIVAGIRRPE